MPYEDAFRELLKRRLPPESIVPGRAYVIHARNGGVGVAVREKGVLGYQLRRVKFKDVFLFVEWDWAEGPPYGTAIPLSEIAEPPPTDETELLAWLVEQAELHEAEIEAARESVLTGQAHTTRD